MVHRLIQTWGGQQVYIPSAPRLRRVLRDQAIFVAHRKGQSVREIARVHHLSEMSIYRIIQAQAKKGAPPKKS